jgi:hypothetical protein
MERAASGLSIASGASWAAPAQPRTFLTQGRTDALEAPRPSLALLEQQVRRPLVACWWRAHSQALLTSLLACIMPLRALRCSALHRTVLPSSSTAQAACQSPAHAPHHLPAAGGLSYGTHVRLLPASLGTGRLIGAGLNAPRMHYSMPPGLPACSWPARPP